mmetsp:Transcript_9812/g.23339  ORF Transcript_9812/g.23339 Transcript_9812/m.23339 type:complete len:236 (+) Transcript_9812:1554-2261(+)
MLASSTPSLAGAAKTACAVSGAVGCCCICLILIRRCSESISATRCFSVASIVTSAWGVCLAVNACCILTRKCSDSMAATRCLSIAVVSTLLSSPFALRIFILRCSDSISATRFLSIFLLSPRPVCSFCIFARRSAEIFSAAICFSDFPAGEDEEGDTCFIWILTRRCSDSMSATFCLSVWFVSIASFSVVFLNFLRNRRCSDSNFDTFSLSHSHLSEPEVSATSVYAVRESLVRR